MGLIDFCKEVWNKHIEASKERRMRRANELIDTIQSKLETLRAVDLDDVDIEQLLEAEDTIDILYQEKLI